MSAQTTAREHDTHHPEPLSEVFGDDYAYFFEPQLQGRAEDDADRILRLAQPDPKAKLLDLACAEGRISHALAARGFDVTGLDISPLFIERAARARGPFDIARRPAFRVADMREPFGASEYDLVLSWFTSFGYHEDVVHERIAENILRALVPGGRFAMEVVHKTFLIKNLQGSIVTKRGEDMCIDEHSIDPRTDRVRTRRTIVREGRTKKTSYEVRLFGAPELDRLLRRAGFHDVRIMSGDGSALRAESPRLVAIATRAP